MTAPACALQALLGRDWAALDVGAYSSREAVSYALIHFTHALVRMLDGDRHLLDLAVFTSLIKEFERSGS